MWSVLCLVFGDLLFAWCPRRFLVPRSQFGAYQSQVLNIMMINTTQYSECSRSRPRSELAPGHLVSAGLRQREEDAVDRGLHGGGGGLALGGGGLRAQVHAVPRGGVATRSSSPPVLPPRRLVVTEFSQGLT